MSVVAVVGAGGMGVASARRLGGGRRIVLGDHDRARLDATVDVFDREGFDVMGQPVDVTSADSVRAFAAAAAEEGALGPIVHTAGLSPTMASGAQVLRVDLVGTAHVIDAFLPYASDQLVLVCIASMAGHFWPMDPETERRMATVPADALVDVAALGDEPDPGIAYAVAKRANIARVRGAAAAYGARGARIVSISPGIISTGMGLQELESQPMMTQMLASSPIRRIGTAEDIAAAAEWLCSPRASFVTGTDLLVDGGVVAAGVAGAGPADGEPA